MARGDSLLRQSLVLDTETTSLGRGSMVHELSILDLQSRELREYTMEPSWVEVQAAVQQDSVRFAESPLDTHMHKSAADVTEAFRAQLLAKNLISVDASKADIEQAMAKHHPWYWTRHKQGLYPHMSGTRVSAQKVAEREAFFASRGVTLRSEASTIQQVLGNDLPGAIQGKTVWIANAPFESKMLGAHLKAMGGGALGRMKGSLETATEEGDPFYVTGSAVGEARIAAARTGDWRGVWRAYLANTPKTGKTAVRDILDVTRAMMSYSQALGISEFNDLYFGTNVDVTSRLFRSVLSDDSPLSGLMGAEAHRAAEDTLTEEFVLKRGIHYTSALQEVEEDTALGRKYMQQAAGGEGPVAEMKLYMQRLKVLEPHLRQANLYKRLGRAVEDLILEGETVQVRGYGKPVTMKTTGGPVRRMNPLRQVMTSMGEVSEFLTTSPGYDQFNVERETLDMLKHVNVGGDRTAKHALLQEYLQNKTAGVIDRAVEEHKDVLGRLNLQDAGKSVTRAVAGTRAGHAVADAMQQMNGKVGAAWAASVTALSMAGTVWSMAGGNKEPVRDQPSLVTYNYQEWLANQQRLQGLTPPNMQGMQEGGIAGRTREFTTDFGSPYQGIMGSQAVFVQQELLREREKWLREQYGVKHYDQQVGLFGLFGPLKGLKPKGYHFIGGGRSVAPGTYQGLRGQNLQQIHLQSGGWKISVQDADTITVKRGGVRGALSSFFGMNRSYNFRLAGIDAPETSHGSTSYHAPQPKADAATAALRSMLAGSKDTTLVYDPTQKTYGRMMGAVITDGKNANFELVRRGMVTHLPFGKSSKSMIDYRAMKKMEDQAFDSSRGIWSSPYYQAFHDATTSGRPTLNTFTKKSRLVENRSLMETLSLMEQAEAQGMYNTSMATEAARLAKVRHPGADRVDPVLFNKPSAHYSGYMHEMITDSAKYMKTHGTGAGQNRFSRRAGYGKLDQTMVLDTMGTSTSIWNKPRYQAFNNYGIRDQLVRQRRAQQAAAQRAVNHQIFQSPINHTRM